MAKREDVKGLFFETVKNKKFQIGLAVVIFLVILYSSTTMRVANLNILKDQTSGLYLPGDPDALYEFRVAQTLLATGDISGIDYMRNPGLDLGYAQEMLPKILVLAYKIVHTFNSSITLDYIDVLYPVVAFAISLIIFFVLCWYLSKSKVVAVIASALLAYSPSYLSRTAGGVSSHEALGMVFFFLALLIFVFSLSRFYKDWKHVIILGVATGVAIGLSFFSWSGASNFVLMIIPLASLLFYLFGLREEEFKKNIKFIVFTVVWIVSSILVMPIFGYYLEDMYNKFLSNYGILTPLTLGFMIVDLYFQKFKEKLKIKNRTRRIFYSIVAMMLVGFIGLILIGRNPLDMLKTIYTQIFFPFGLERVNLTVAYYAQPYITDLIGQYTPAIFWLFFLGMIFMGFETGKSISSLKHRIGFVVAWIIAISGMMFSRISVSSIFNGTNILSRFVYILSFLIFGGYFLWLYLNDKFEINARNVLLFAWMFVMLLSTRSAVRVIFVIYSFVAFAVAFAVFKLFAYAKNAKDPTAKYVLYIFSVLAIILVLFSLFGNPLSKSAGSYQITKYSAANMGPIANYQWQSAMAWVRNNTLSTSIFLHWWDYGYLVQTIGHRTTVLDGGNAQAYWDYMMGRYVLTTPKPETALSFMKSHNVSYLIIDPTDVGKYGAYSKIGGNKEQDRYSSGPITVVTDPKQMTETANGTRRVYGGSSFVDEDINYGNIFLPGPVYDSKELPTYKSYFVGIFMESAEKNGSALLKQAQAVFVYNGNQYSLPVRYTYFNGRIIDYGSGINSTFMLIPNIQQTSGGQIQVDSLGAGLYLSKRVQEGLFTRLYLMGDSYNQYSSVKEAHTEDDYVVRSLKAQGLNVGDFVYYQGLRAPLKIWKVDYPSNILDHPELRARDGEYGAADSLSFISN